MDTITKIGGIFPGSSGGGSPMGSLGTLLQLIFGGMGTVGNMQSGRQQAGIASSLAEYQKMMTEMAKNPAILAQKAASVRQPLSLGLQENVGNETQAILAQRGLATSPAQATAITSQTLAPYEQEAQRVAMDAVLRQLGLPITAGGTAAASVPKPVDTSQFWKLFFPKTAQPSIPDSRTTSTAGDSPWGGGTSGDIYSWPMPDAPNVSGGRDISTIANPDMFQGMAP